MRMDITDIITGDSIKTIYESNVFSVVAAMMMVGCFLLGMVSNSERFRNWFNEVQRKEVYRFDHEKEDELSGFQHLFVALVMTAPMTVSFWALVLTGQMGMKGHMVMAVVLLTAMFTFIAQRLYAFTFKEE